MVSLKEAMAKVKAKKGIKAVSDGINGSDNAYWKPEERGVKIEGFVAEITDGDYGPEIILSVERGDERMDVKLPGHSDLQSKTADVFEGDYLYVELVDIKKSNNPEYADKLIYGVDYIQSTDIPDELKE